jgi:hypothetical protein
MFLGFSDPSQGDLLRASTCSGLEQRPPGIILMYSSSSVITQYDSKA